MTKSITGSLPSWFKLRCAQLLRRGPKDFPTPAFLCLKLPDAASTHPLPRCRAEGRHDGWTAARQTRFIEVLAATTSISKACSAVGMSRVSAYKLRDGADARQFRLAWNAALRPSFDESRRGGAPKLTIHRQPTSSALQTLQTCLAELRVQEQELGSPR